MEASDGYREAEIRRLVKDQRRDVLAADSGVNVADSNVVNYGLWGENLPCGDFRPAVTRSSAHFVDEVAEVLAESEKIA